MYGEFNNNTSSTNDAARQQSYSYNLAISAHYYDNGRDCDRLQPPFNQYCPTTILPNANCMSETKLLLPAVMRILTVDDNHTRTVAILVRGRTKNTTGRRIVLFFLTVLQVRPRVQSGLVSAHFLSSWRQLFVFLFFSRCTL